MIGSKIELLMEVAVRWGDWGRGRGSDSPHHESSCALFLPMWSRGDPSFNDETENMFQQSEGASEKSFAVTRR